jgi:hypothetical protein
MWGESAPIREIVQSRRWSLKKRFLGHVDRRVDAASESLFRAPRGRSTQPLSGSTASRSSRESLSRPAKIHFRLKPHLSELFRDLDVTRRYTLTLVSDDQLHMVDVSVLVFHHRGLRVLVNEGFSGQQNGLLGRSVPDP